MTEELFDERLEDRGLFDASEIMRRQLRQSRVVLTQLLTHSAIECMNEGVCTQLGLKRAE